MKRFGSILLVMFLKTTNYLVKSDVNEKTVRNNLVKDQRSGRA